MSAVCSEKEHIFEYSVGLEPESLSLNLVLKLATYVTVGQVAYSLVLVFSSVKCGDKDFKQRGLYWGTEIMFVKCLPS